MRIRAIFKPEKVLSRHMPETAPQTHLHLDAKRSVIEATNGYAYVSIPVRVEKGDKTGLLPVAALEIARRVVARQFKSSLQRVKLHDREMSMQTSKDEVVIDGVASFTRPQIKTPFPTAKFVEVRDRLIAAMEDQRNSITAEPFYVEFGVNVRLLKEVVDALGIRDGQARISLQVPTADETPPNEQAILVRAPYIRMTGEDEPWGIVMPIRLR